MWVYGQPLNEPILGKQFQLPSQVSVPRKLTLDKSLPYVSLLII